MEPREPVLRTKLLYVHTSLALPAVLRSLCTMVGSIARMSAFRFGTTFKH